MPPALVVLNPAARGGTARSLWESIENRVRNFVAPRVIETAGDWRGEIRSAILQGTRVFLAAGGDGTVNLVVNALIDLKGSVSLTEFKLGAIGLGSSNDFHKPYSDSVPVKVDPTGGGRRDVVRVQHRAPDGTSHVRHFVVSASLGVTARANAFFNSGDAALRGLKKRWTSAAILYAAGRTIGRHRNSLARVDGRLVALSNLSLLKTPYLSGAFRFDLPIRPDDGRFAIALAEGMRRLDLLRLMADLGRGRFLGRPGRRHWSATSLKVEMPSPEPLEMDGEIVLIRKAEFEVLPEKIGVCR